MIENKKWISIICAEGHPRSLNSEGAFLENHTRSPRFLGLLAQSIKQSAWFRLGLFVGYLRSAISFHVISGRRKHRQGPFDKSRFFRLEHIPSTLGTQSLRLSTSNARYHFQIVITRLLTVQDVRAWWNASSIFWHPASFSSSGNIAAAF